MVHVYSMNGMNVAVDGNSGSINILDDAACELLKHLKAHFHMSRLLKS